MDVSHEKSTKTNYGLLYGEKELNEELKIILKIVKNVLPFGRA